MRIIHIVPTPTGAPWMAALAREQQRLGHDVIALLPSIDGQLGRALAAAGVPARAASVDILLAKSHSQRLAIIINMARLFRELRPDVVHSHILNSVITARLAGWLADVPNRFGGNVGPLTLESAVLRALELGSVFGDTKTIASCVHTRELYIELGVPPEQTELVYYAVDQSGHDPALADGARVRRELGIADDAPVIGKIAYIYGALAGLVDSRFNGRAVKGHDVLVRAMPRVLESFPNAKLVIVGRGWGEQGEEHLVALKKLVADLGIADAVIFTGERSDVPDLLACFDVSTQCSLTDNLAGTVESLLMARPTVTSDIPGFRDTVLHEKTGLRVPPDDPTALADAIIRLLRDRELAKRLGENGRAWMLERFTLARAVADYEELFARTPARAKDGYRWWVTLARIVQLPFRLYALMRRVHLTTMGPVPPLWKRILIRARVRAGRIVRAVFPRAENTA